MRVRIAVKNWNGKSLYSINCIGNPLNEGEEPTMYFMDVQFSKCTPPTEKCYINVDYGFMSSYKAKGDIIKPKMVIMGYTVIQETPKTAQSSGIDGATEIKDEDVPF